MVLAAAILLVLVAAVVAWLGRRARFLLRPSPIPSMRVLGCGVKTGDFLSVCNTGLGMGASAAFVKLATASHHNHSAVAYRDPLTGIVFAADLTFRGMRLIPLADLVAMPGHVISTRALSRHVDQGTMEAALRSQWRDRYDCTVALAFAHRFLPFSLPGASFLRGTDRGSAASARTCAHSVVEVYQRLGVLDFTDSDIDPSAVFTSDFMGDETLPLPLANGFTLGPARRLIP